MTLRHFSVFLTVRDEKSMTSAARVLNVAQPAISQTIKELEAYYHVRLFERLGKRLCPTDAAERLTPYARHILNLYREMETALFSMGDSALVRVGASVTVGTCVLPALVASFQGRYPYLRVEAVVDNTQVIEQLLLNDGVDIGVVEGVVQTGELLSHAFAKDELVLIFSPIHRFAGRDSVPQKDLEEEAFIVREEGSGTRELFASVLAAAGISWRPAWVCNNAETIKKAVGANRGISVISRLAVADELSQGTLKSARIEGLDFSRNFSIVRHKNKYLTEQMESFIDFLKENAGV